MKNLLLILTIIPIFVFSQNDTLIDKGIYKIYYSQKLKQPLSATYKLYNYKNSDVKRKGNFYNEKGVITSSNKDYSNNDYDKGHLAPAENFSDTKENMKTTFSYVNCALQHYKLNRGVWKSLESQERKLSTTDSLLVEINVYFTYPLVLNSNGTAIPSYFEKKITFLTTKTVIIYMFPNKECKSNLEEYLIK